MSQIHDQPLSLEEVVAWSRLIVEAERVPPGLVHAEIELGEGLPPLLRSREWLALRRVLWSDGVAVPAGSVAVDLDDWERRLARHRAEHAGGPSRGVIEYVYRPSDPGLVERPELRICFLGGEPGAWRFACRDAVESPAARERVLAAIAALHPPADGG